MANIISILRIILVFISVFLLFQDGNAANITAIVLIIIAFISDGLDGWVARKFNETSKFGAMLDIMCDRIAENTYWVVFAVMGLLSPVFPIIVLTRGFVVDGIRSVAMEQGLTAFGETSMQTSKVGQFICSSKFIRILYAVVKAVAFVFLAAANVSSFVGNTYSSFIYNTAFYASIIAVILCVIRGIPVVVESRRLFKNEN